MRYIGWILVASALLLVPPTAVGQETESAAANVSQQDAAGAIRITSPLGRTGLTTKLRIVAQVAQPRGHSLSPLNFYVDGKLVGTVESGPPYAVEWTDENPFEPREIIVEASDSNGRAIRDVVSLPPFEITDVTDVTSVLLETGVYDKSGRFVSYLDPATFRILENGVPQKIDQASTETLPTTTVLLVDNSQSMSYRMDFVQRAAERLASTLRKRDRVVVAPFTAGIGTVTGPTNDLPTITQAIRAMRGGGGTAVLDVLLEAAAMLKGIEGRRNIVLITDGYDENSTAAVDEVLKRANEAGVVVYVVAVGGVAGVSLKGQVVLKQVADRTGGRVFFPPRENELLTAAQDIAADANSRYLIAYTPENQTKDGSWREVTVEVPEGFRARTRPGYFAPKPPPIRPTIEFTVTNSSHDHVDVSVEDLEVLEDGVAQTIDTFQEAVEPVSLVLALDQSGSMKKSADLVRGTARDFVVAVRPEDDLALMTFDDTARPAHTFGRNRTATLDAIGQYTPNGGTALYDGLWESLTLLKPVTGRRAIVVLSDGRDENNPGTAPGSFHKLDEVLALGREVGATIFAVGLGTNVDRGVLEMIAAESGGEAYFAADASALGAQFERVIQNLRRRYVLGYSSTNLTHDGKWRKIEIRPRLSSYRIATKGGYFAPEQ